MKKVVLFKSASEDYEKIFNECNYEVLFIEPLQFEFKNTSDLSEKLESQNYDGLILTSPRAIEAVSKCWDPSKFVKWNSRRNYTIGEASRKKTNLLLGLDPLGATSGSADNLAKIIMAENAANSKFLFPCGNLASEILPNMLKSKNITVDSLTVYETKENENLREQLMELNKGEIDLCCVVFFSPSGCEYVHRQLQTFNNKISNLPYFAIGNSTAHKIENLIHEIAGVASTPNAECLLEAILEYFQNK